MICMKAKKEAEKRNRTLLLLVALLCFSAFQVSALPNARLHEYVEAYYSANGTNLSTTSLGRVYVDVNNAVDVLQYIRLNLSNTSNTNLNTVTAYRAVAAGNGTIVYLNTTNDAMDTSYRLTSGYPLFALRTEVSNLDGGNDMIANVNPNRFTLTFSVNVTQPLSSAFLEFFLNKNSSGSYDALNITSLTASNGTLSYADTNSNNQIDYLNWTGSFGENETLIITLNATLLPRVYYNATDQYLDLNDISYALRINRTYPSTTLTGRNFSSRFSRGPIRQGVELQEGLNPNGTMWRVRGMIKNIASDLLYVVNGWALYNISNLSDPKLSNTSTFFLYPGDSYYTSRYDTNIQARPYYTSAFNWQVLWDNATYSGYTAGYLHLQTLYETDLYITKSITPDHLPYGTIVYVTDRIYNTGSSSISDKFLHAVTGISPSWNGLQNLTLTHVRGVIQWDITQNVTYNLSGNTYIIDINFTNMSKTFEANDYIVLNYEIHHTTNQSATLFNIYLNATSWTQSGTPLTRVIDTQSSLFDEAYSGGTTPGPSEGGGGGGGGGGNVGTGFIKGVCYPELDVRSYSIEEGKYIAVYYYNPISQKTEFKSLYFTKMDEKSVTVTLEDNEYLLRAGSKISFDVNKDGITDVTLTYPEGGFLKDNNGKMMYINIDFVCNVNRYRMYLIPRTTDLILTDANRGKADLNVSYELSDPTASTLKSISLTLFLPPGSQLEPALTRLVHYDTSENVTVTFSDIQPEFLGEVEVNSSYYEALVKRLAYRFTLPKNFVMEDKDLMRILSEGISFPEGRQDLLVRMKGYDPFNKVNLSKDIFLPLIVPQKRDVSDLIITEYNFTHGPLYVGESSLWTKVVDIYNPNNFSVQEKVSLSLLSDLLSAYYTIEGERHEFDIRVINGATFGVFPLSLSPNQRVVVSVGVVMPPVIQQNLEFTILDDRGEYVVVQANITLLNPSKEFYDSVFYRSPVSPSSVIQLNDVGWFVGNESLMMLQNFTGLELKNLLYTFREKKPYLRNIMLKQEYGCEDYLILTTLVSGDDLHTFNVEYEINDKSSSLPIGYETYYGDIMSLGKYRQNTSVMLSPLLSISGMPNGKYELNAILRKDFSTMVSSTDSFTIECKDRSLKKVHILLLLLFAALLLFVTKKTYDLQYWLRSSKDRMKFRDILAVLKSPLLNKETLSQISARQQQKLMKKEEKAPPQPVEPESAPPLQKKEAGAAEAAEPEARPASSPAVTPPSPQQPQDVDKVKKALLDAQSMKDKLLKMKTSFAQKQEPKKDEKKE